MKLIANKYLVFYISEGSVGLKGNKDFYTCYRNGQRIKFNYHLTNIYNYKTMQIMIHVPQKL